MLERLHVRSFRGFHDLEVTQLGRINLVAGANNVGKTTLLEAVFLLSGAANARMAINGHVIRDQDQGKSPRSWASVYWKPFFAELNTSQPVIISGHHSTIGDMKLDISWGRKLRTEIPREEHGKAHSHEQSLKFTYFDQQSGAIESEINETVEKFNFGQKHKYIPFATAILQPGDGDVNDDAVSLGQLRTQKRGHHLLDALQVVEPRLQGIEDNSSSGDPMIWVDIGLRELVPLLVMGAGLTHVARIVLRAAVAKDGVLLIDEIENGLHHSVLSNVWLAIERVVELFGVQIFATTHSRECVAAAYDALGADGFRLHRLDVAEETTRCVTYSSEALEGAMRHNLEFR
ncbi:MAG: AAA family ATPase [Rhodospirillaceae bacterium]|nr:AAA family ATPase [Rhodospirillaceae bacterium]